MNNSLPYNVADHTKVYGNKHFRHYLVGKNHDLLIECGVTASANQFIKQLVDSRIGAPDKLLVMHAHFDHVCGIPVLKHNFPDAKVLSSAAAAKVLKNPKVVENFFDQDRQISRYFSANMVAPEVGLPICPNRIEVDRIVNGGDLIALKGGEILKLIPAPGHSPCGLAAWFEKDRALFVSDALGFQISDEKVFPVFFHAYQPYIETIKRLAKYPADTLAFPHERIWQGKSVKAIFLRALSAAQNVRDEIVSEAEKGIDLSNLKQMLFDRFYCKNLRIYSTENIRLCVDLLVRRSLEDGFAGNF